ncbi:hypothetical protein [Polycladidibacter hongkongensis]|uniref:hypothetical protein n=1 Tax=Polycladidibacter hongkongensis TaxID=1647556 RepID=UPI0008295675|nr:hypothetical protein [Pseudovibrio hongkongensis]
MLGGCPAQPIVIALDEAEVVLMEVTQGDALQQDGVVFIIANDRVAALLLAGANHSRIIRKDIGGKLDDIFTTFA